MTNNKYAKLVNNELQFAPNPIKINNSYIGNPSDDLYIQEGYKLIVYTKAPVVEEGYIATFDWNESETEITQIWNIEPEGDISDEEALSILLGE